MTANKKHYRLHISGMTCANCAAGLQKHLEKKGLEEVAVSFANSEASFTLSNHLTLSKVTQEIESIGYRASKQKQSESEENDRIEKLFAFCLVLTIPLFAHMFLESSHVLQNPIVQIILCLPVYAIGAYHFGKSAWGSLKMGVPNMDVLILMGTSAAFLYSLIGTSMHWGTAEAHHFLFFETTATIITLVLLGNVLEHRSVAQTTSAIKELSAFQKLIAKKETPDGKYIELDFEAIQKGDILIVNTGDKIPADGNILTGEGLLDESMLTGESDSVHKKEGSSVIGGTILTDGNIRMEALNVGKNTVLSQIIELVKKAQNDKPNIQRLGDKVSAVFVPVVIVIAVLTFILAHFIFNITVANALMRSIAVLVISCPCAMGLATPTAVMAGLGRAAKNGILIKGGNTLEVFAKVKNIVFDKTGTLTNGQFELKKIHCNAEKLEEVKKIIYSLECHSTHPIAQSLVKSLSSTSRINIDQIKEHKGKGIEGVWKGNHYFLGSYEQAKNITKKKSHQLFLIKNKQLIASLEISDRIRENAKESIHQLSKDGINSLMLSGDTEEKCLETAKKIGIKTVYSEQLPVEKLSIIKALSKEQVTAMVGDGVNDAPALAAAQVGISLSSGTQVAIQSAQIVLLKSNDLKQVNKALQISKHTLLTIKQNLFWAFSYNIVAIPIAALGFLNPMWGALFMAFSDVIVIGNSLRLKTKRLSQ